MKFIFKAFTKSNIQKLVILLLVDGLLFCNTNARNVSSIFLIVGFGLLLMTIFYIWLGLLSLLSFYGLVIHRPHYLALCLSILSGGLLALQSVGELSPHDIAVLVPISLLVYFYSSYSSSAKRKPAGD
jgi:high-affinity Fe2+/Pb2+ permease